MSKIHTEKIFFENSRRLKVLLQTAIGKNIMANIFKVFVIFLNQIVLIPIYILYWGTELYGDWIILSATTSFFSLSDGGLNNATNNLYCIKYAQGQLKQCQTLIINNYVVVFCLGFTSLLTISIFCFYFDITHFLSLRSTDRMTSSIVLLLMILQIFIQMTSSVANSVYNSKSLTSRSTYLDNGARLTNAFLIFIGILSKSSLITVSLLGLLPYVVLLFYKTRSISKSFGIAPQLKNFNFNILKKLLTPSLYYLSFPIGNIFIFQGYTLLIGSLYGATELVLFNTTRTMVNFVRVMVLTVVHAVKPEFSLLYGKSQFKKLYILHKRTITYSLLVATISCLTLLLMGEFVYTIWTKGKLSFSFSLMLSFFLVVIINAYWEASSISMVSTNNHIMLGKVYVSSSIASILMGYYISITTHSLALTAASLIISDVAMSVYSHFKSKQLMFLYPKVLTNQI